MFSEEDLNQIHSKGIDIKKINEQVENFKQGFPKIALTESATPTKGLKSIDQAETENLAKFFDEHASEKNIIKFVPASGAASRMFKHLHEFISSSFSSSENKC